MLLCLKVIPVSGKEREKLIISAFIDRPTSVEDVQIV